MHIRQINKRQINKSLMRQPELIIISIYFSFRQT